MEIRDELLYKLITSRMEQIEAEIRPLEKEYKQLADILMSWERGTDGNEGMQEMQSEEIN